MDSLITPHSGLRTEEQRTRRFVSAITQRRSCVDPVAWVVVSTRRRHNSAALFIQIELLVLRIDCVAQEEIIILINISLN